MNLPVMRSVMFAAVALIASTLSAQNLKPNQTLGYGESKILRFTYNQNFDCIDEPFRDLNFNGVIAAKDPNEMQIPICQLGTNPEINPPGQFGNPIETTEPVYVLVPMFSLDDDQNPNDAISCANVVPGTICGSALGSELIKLFGSLPEGFKAKPLVYTQCPEPGAAPGTCTMHASRLDLAPVLAALGYTGPPKSNVFVPSPNHSHILLHMDDNIKPIWWQVIPVLVTNQADWPSKDGTTGITSFEKLQNANAAGRVVEAPSNFFLFFSSNVVGDHSHSH